MDKQARPPVIPDPVEDSDQRLPAPGPAVVPFRTALCRWALGLALGVGAVLALAWWYSDGLLAILGPLCFLRRQEDRRGRSAFGVALLVALPVTVALSVMLKDWLPQPWDGIVFAGVGSLLGSIGYAAVTRWGVETR